MGKGQGSNQHGPMTHAYKESAIQHHQLSGSRGNLGATLGNARATGNTRLENKVACASYGKSLTGHATLGSSNQSAKHSKLHAPVWKTITGACNFGFQHPKSSLTAPPQKILTGSSNCCKDEIHPLARAHGGFTTEQKDNTRNDPSR